jgi:hypothetical protein
MKNIDSKKEYNISQLAELGVFGVKNRRSVLMVILEDILKKNILECKGTGSGHGARYSIKGSNIIKYLKKNHA